MLLPHICHSKIHYEIRRQTCNKPVLPEAERNIAAKITYYPSGFCRMLSTEKLIFPRFERCTHGCRRAFGTVRTNRDTACAAVAFSLMINTVFNVAIYALYGLTLATALTFGFVLLFFHIVLFSASSCLHSYCCTSAIKLFNKSEKK